MPGSPPTSRAEPCTSPPPHTRSNSRMCECRRGAWAEVPESCTKSSRRPAAARPAPRPFGAASGAASSTSVFHSLQDSHLPLHLGKLAPQLWQTYREVGRAKERSSVLDARGNPAPRKPDI